MCTAIVSGCSTRARTILRISPANYTRSASKHSSQQQTYNMRVRRRRSFVGKIGRLFRMGRGGFRSGRSCVRFGITNVAPNNGRQCGHCVRERCVCAEITTSVRIFTFALLWWTCCAMLRNNYVIIINSQSGANGLGRKYGVFATWLHHGGRRRW